MSSSPNMMEVRLQRVTFDRPTPRKFAAFVVGICSVGTEEAQVYISRTSFMVRRDGRADTVDQKVWDGDGALMAMFDLQGLDRLEAEFYLVRDRSRARATGDVMAELFAPDGLVEAVGQDTADAAKRLAEGFMKSAEKLAGTVAKLDGLHQVFRVGEAAGRLVSRVLQATQDRVLVRGVGGLKRSSLDTADADGEEIVWSQDRNDKGQIVFEIDYVTVGDPTVTLEQPVVEWNLKGWMNAAE